MLRTIEKINKKKTHKRTFKQRGNILSIFSDVELGAMFFILHKAVRTCLCESSERGGSRHVSGVSLHGEAQAACLCFVNRDYETAAGRQVGRGGDCRAICFPQA